jgi:peptidoglycan hydrolase-like protein with peptidoglycan-binding domain
MPYRRPPPVRLDLKSQVRKRAAASKPAKPKAPKRPRKPHSNGDDSSAPYWIAGALIVLLGVLGGIYYEVPEIRNAFGISPGPEDLHPENEIPLPQKSVNAPVVTHVPAPAPQPTAEEIQMRKLREQVALEKKLLAERPAPLPVVPPPLPPKPVAQVAPPPPPPILPPLAPPAPTPPSLAQPLPIGTVPGMPARALPVDLNKLDTEQIAAYQVALERIHFSCGFIDGDQGMRTQRMLRAYQASRGLPITGFLDQPTRDAIGEPGEPFLTYTVTADDVDSIMPKPETWIAKSKATRLGYNDIWELLAEKFHCTRAYLKALNRTVSTPMTGTEIIGPKVYPAAPIPHAASLRISLSDTSIEPLDASGRIIGFFPCSIAKDKAKRPHGLLTVKVVDPHPDYTFDPALFADASKEEGITHKLTIPPGPRNPVGTTWVGLSLPGYGIHGTPEPENISRTQSHGCFRLANWNAEKVLKMVKVGTPVDVVE